MINLLRAAAVAVGALCASAVGADATLTYELTGPDGDKTSKTLSIARFFARVDDDSQPGIFLLYQAGKFFPLYRVNQARRTYTRLTPEVRPFLSLPGVSGPAVVRPEPKPASGALEEAASGPAGADRDGEAGDSGTAKVSAAANAAARTMLQPTGGRKTVGGVRCRVVQELEGDRPILEHCMANKADLGITEREIRTLARTFVMSRERGLGWLATATEDEAFVSVASRDLGGERTLKLAAVSRDPLAPGYLRVPREFKEVPASQDTVPEPAGADDPES
jgi:hypothetical protein